MNLCHDRRILLLSKSTKKWMALVIAVVAITVTVRQEALAQEVEGFKGKIGPTYKESVPHWPEPVKPPKGAPNVLIWLIDDAGFAQLGSYGGLINTPTLDRLAQQGLRYTNFHATAVCAPSRAVLLTGRNHHAVHMGAHVKGARGFPGYDGHIPKSAASLAKVLKMNGYGTYAVGKWDQIPDKYVSPAGPFDYWPSGQGFDHFYGFLAAETDHFNPQVYSDHTQLDPAIGRRDYHFTTDMADQAIRAINGFKAVAPQHPFLVYWATGAVHSPHHAPRSYLEKYRGKFNMGWDRARELILEKQKSLGIVPDDATLPPRPEEIIPAWNSLSADAKRMHARQMEAFAAMLEHTDYEFGRVLKELERIGELDNTLIIVTSDNGASAEGGPEGSYNEIRFSNGLKNTLALNLSHFDQWGGPEVFNHYSVGWAMAGNTPLKYYKQSVFAGGERVPLIISWKKRGVDQGEIRNQFHHLNDIMPTVLAAAGIPQPEMVDGVKQDPFDGVSMTYSFAQGAAPSPKQVQYFELWGNRAIWADGWKAVVNHYYRPWDMMQKNKPFNEETWELYHVAQDFNELTDLAAGQPEKLAEMLELFDREARKNHVYPLKEARDGSREVFLETEDRIKAVSGHFAYSPSGVERIIEALAPPVKNRSFTITADIEVPKGGAEGVLVSMGGRPAGYSLYVKDNNLVYTHNYMGEQWYTLRADKPLAPGKNKVQFVFAKTGNFQGTGTLKMNGEVVAQGNIDRTYPAQVPINETFDIGCDNGTAVSKDYDVPFAFTGRIEKVDFEVPPMSHP